MNRHIFGFWMRLGLIALIPASLIAEDRPLVVTLHPILSEMVTRIVGDSLRVETLLPPQMDPHTFDPSPRELARAQQAALVVAMGKNLEPYLDRIRQNLPPGVRVYEAGRPVPSLTIDPKNEAFACCPVHAHGAIDPHWWQSPLAMQRAVRHLGRELENLVPEQRESFRANTRKLMDELAQLDAWIRTELSVIPRDNRRLVTAHLSFGYFCDAYGFQALPIRGLNSEDSPTPAHLAEAIETLQRAKVRAVFPEKKANNTVLESLREAVGVRIAEPLIADIPGQGMDYFGMFRHNVRLLVEYLGPESTPTP